MKPRPRRLDRSAAHVYISTLAAGASRETGAKILRRLVAIASPEAETLESFDFSKLTYRQTQRMRAALVDRYSPATANLHLSMLRRVLDEAFALGQMGAAQYQRARSVRNVRGRARPRGRALSQAELAKLIQCCRSADRPKGPRDAAIFALLFGAGLRRRELVSIDLPHGLDLERALIRVQTKGRKHRTADLQPPVEQALSDWLDCRGRQPGPLFVAVDRFGNLGSDTLTPGAIFKLCKARGDEAELEPFSPHDFRRTFANDLLDAGVDLHVVSEMMDHESLQTTAGYDPGRTKRRRSAAARLRMPF